MPLLGVEFTPETGIAGVGGAPAASPPAPMLGTGAWGMVLGFSEKCNKMIQCKGQWAEDPEKLLRREKSRFISIEVFRSSCCPREISPLVISEHPFFLLSSPYLSTRIASLRESFGYYLERILHVLDL